MITDERLKELLEYAYDIAETEVLGRDLHSALSELLEARRKIGILKEDAERLAKFATDTASHDWTEVITMTLHGHMELIEMINRHNQVMKEVE